MIKYENKHTKRFTQELLQDCQDRCYNYDVVTASFADDEEINMLNRLKHRIKNSFTENYLTNVLKMRCMMKILSRNEKEKTTDVQINVEASLFNIKGCFFDRLDPTHCGICNKKLYYDELCIHSANFIK